MRSILSLAATALLVNCLAAAIPPAPVLAPLAGGGWRSTGLPYSAVFSAAGYLESLTVNGFDLISPSKNPAHGLFLVDGDKPSLFTAVTCTGDTMVMSNECGKLTVRLFPTRLEISVLNIAFKEGSCARLELTRSFIRAKNPDIGIEYPLPTNQIVGKMRLFAANGANLTLNTHYLAPATAGYLVRLPAVRMDGPAEKFTIDIASKPAVEDLLKVTAKAQNADFVYWNGGPQQFTTELMNMQPKAPFRGAVQVRLRTYLTKEMAREMQQAVTLPAAGTKSVNWTVDNLAPGLYIAEIWLSRGKESGCNSAPRFVYQASQLLPAAPPEDFTAFWQRTLAEQTKIPPDLQMTKVKDQDKSELYKFNFAGLLGHRCYGYLTVPKDKSKKYPAVLLLPSSGVHRLYPFQLPDGNCVGMAINIAFVDVDLPDEQYDWRTWPAPYLVTGILDPNYYTLRFSYAALVRAAEILAARPEVQADNMLVTGSSQGGGLTLVAAGLYPKFKAAVANVPGLCRLDWSFDYLNPPYFPIAANADTRPMISHTLSYYDATQFARNIHCPIWVSLGLMDDVTPSMGVFCAYNAIPTTQKQLLVQPLTGHGGGYDYMTVTKGVWP